MTLDELLECPAHLFVHNEVFQSSAALDLFFSVRPSRGTVYVSYATAPTLNRPTMSSTPQFRPVHGRSGGFETYWDSRRSAWASTFFTSLLGIAKPIPTFPADISF